MNIVVFKYQEDTQPNDKLSSETIRSQKLKLETEALS